MSWHASELDESDLIAAERTWVRQYAWLLEKLAGPLTPVEYIDLWDYREHVRARVLEIEAELGQRAEVGAQHYDLDTD